jgi:hypothetical protein
MYLRGEGFGVISLIMGMALAMGLGISRVFMKARLGFHCEITTFSNLE